MWNVNSIIDSNLGLFVWKLCLMNCLIYTELPVSSKFHNTNIFNIYHPPVDHVNFKKCKKKIQFLITAWITSNSAFDLKEKKLPNPSKFWKIRLKWVWFRSMKNNQGKWKEEVSNLWSCVFMKEKVGSLRHEEMRERAEGACPRNRRRWVSEKWSVWNFVKMIKSVSQLHFEVPCVTHTSARRSACDAGFLILKKYWPPWRQLSWNGAVKQQLCCYPSNLFSVERLYAKYSFSTY